MHTSRDIRYVNSTPDKWPPSLIANSSRRAVVLSDPENIRLAFEIVLLPSLGAEICAFQFFVGRHLGFSSLGPFHFGYTLLMFVSLE